MANVLRPLMQLSRWHSQCCRRAALYHSLFPLSACCDSGRCLLFIPPPFSLRSVHFRARGLRSRRAPSPLPMDSSESDSESEGDVKKSRNEKKRDARRAVKWGMELATFSPFQIQLIMRAVSLDREVYDALMLVKRLGRDVREGKRRQFNYIGRLLREVEPEQMDGLIQATKDGDQSKFYSFSCSGLQTSDIEEEEGDYHEDEEDSHSCTTVARWFDGLVNKDAEITNEIYSVSYVEFDRQELRRLVRKVHSMQERVATSDQDGTKISTALVGAERSLTCFLQKLAKHMAAE